MPDRSKSVVGAGRGPRQPIDCGPGAVGDRGRLAGLRRTDRTALTTLGPACILLAAAVVLSGCAQTKGWLDRVTPGKDSARSGDPVFLGAPEADDYLAELERLATGDPATQIEIFADAESRATLTPDPSTTLRFALVLATPGHAETNSQRAQSLLRELLTQTPLMTPAETALARIYLNTVEQRIVLESEARRLRETSSRQARTQAQAVNQRLAAVESENRRLRQELADAENKLEAIMSIERSIRDRDQ